MADLQTVRQDYERFKVNTDYRTALLKAHGQVHSGSQFFARFKLLSTHIWKLYCHARADQKALLAGSCDKKRPADRPASAVSAEGIALQSDIIAT